MKNDLYTPHSPKVSLTEQATPDCEISENAIVNMDYYNLVCKNQLVDCNICLGLLIDPLMCEECQTPYCKSCIEKWKKKNNKCPFNCSSFSLVPINRSLKNLMDGLIIKCQSCESITSLFKYPEHKLKCVKVSCFNCGSIVSKKVLTVFEDANVFKKFCHKPVEAINKILCFHIYVWADKYSGFLSASSSGWLKLTRNRSSANYFSFYFIDNNMYFKVYHEGSWLCIQPHYDLGVGLYSVGESINYNSIKQQIISNSGRTKGFPLTLRKTDYYFYFYQPTEKYIECNARLVYCNE